MASSSPEPAAPPFPEGARILQFDYQPRSEQRVCLLWPAWAFRVSAPVVELRTLDLFHRVVLALSQAGVRSADAISALIGLHPRMCAYVIDVAVAAGHLDHRQELTPAGRDSLRAGSSMARPTWRICYVFQDPFTGELWPRTVERLRPAHVRREAGDLVELQLRTAGRSDIVEVRRIVPPPERPQRPTAARVIAASSADQVDRKIHLVQDFERHERFRPVAPPEEVIAARAGPTAADEVPELSRVSFIDEPEPVQLVGFIEVTAGTNPSTDSLWEAHDPFGLGLSEFFHSLVYRREHAEVELSAEIHWRAEAERGQVRERSRRSNQEMRSMVETGLVDKLGPGVRADRDAFDFMTELELALESPERDGPLERAAHAAFRLHEVLFRRMVAAYPLAPDRLRSLLVADAMRRALIERAAQGIGFDAVHPLVTAVSNAELEKTARNPRQSYVKALVPLALVAASVNPDHPLRRIASRRPDLLVVLGTLNALRNRAEHGPRDVGLPSDPEWYRSLGMLAAQALLELSDPTAERVR